jgi:transcriptional regulator with XRE-family HTH domain
MAEGTPGERIGRRLRDVREAGLYTRNELAKRSGVAASTIEDLEIGEVARPRRTTIDKLAEALGVEAEALMYGAEVDDVPLGEATPTPPDTTRVVSDEALRRANKLVDLDADEADALLQTLPVDALIGLQRELMLLLRYRYGPRVFETMEEIVAYMQSEDKRRGDRVGERLGRVTGIIGERVAAEVREARERPLTHA